MELIHEGSRMAQYIRAVFGRSERGSAMVEYALLLALIAVVCLLAVTYLGTSVSGRISHVASQVAAS